MNEQNPDLKGPPRPDLRKQIISDALFDPQAVGVTATDDDPIPVVIELNAQHSGGLDGAFKQLIEELGKITDRARLTQTADTYVQIELSINQVKSLVNVDLGESWPEPAIYRIWPDFPIYPLVDRSCKTVKVDAARRSYGASGRDIVWAVIDSGIDQEHPHFTRYGTLVGDVKRLHQDFTEQADVGVGSALTDAFGHGTHVAGIIAGEPPTTTEVRVFQQVQDPEDPKQTRTEPRTAYDRTLLAGMAPQTKLVSLKVLDKDGRGSSMNVIRALEYVRTQLNGQKLMRVHGVNLSVGYEFDPTWFACGQSPICVAVDRLVRSGVVVVIAAGNTGYGSLISGQRPTNVGLTMTINDPGNAEMAITVGATHRDMPHTYGVSYFSSKGPTGDGRVKPDLIAPGERITSCCAEGKLTSDLGGPGQAVYVEDSGTSAAAPHVSGAIAGFLSIRSEFIGQPERIKQIFTSSATSLGREHYFQGHGLVDLMRAIQSV